MRRYGWHRLFGWLLILVVGGTASRGWADMRERIDAMAAENVDRGTGSEAAAKNADYLAAELSKATGQPVRRQGFLLALPQIDKCVATDHTAGGNAIALSPMAASGGQIAALPSADPHEVLYAGRGALEELKGKDLTDRIVVLEIASDAVAWRTAASFGASAIIFLGDAHARTTDFLNKAMTIPVAIPRFYCDDPASVENFRQNRVRRLAIGVHGSWQEKRLDNLLCFVPGQINPREFITIQARYDASSQVMGRAPGASEAAGPAALIELARSLAASPHHVSVLFVLTAGDEWNFHGARRALDLLNLDFDTAKTAADDLRKDVTDADARLSRARQTLTGLEAIVAGKWSFLADNDARTQTEDALLRQSAAVEAKLEHARINETARGAEFDALNNRKESILSAMGALGPSDPRSIVQETSIRAAASDAVPRWQLEARRLAALRDALAPWPDIRLSLGDRRPMLFLSLALSSGSPRFGFFARSFYAQPLDFSGKAFTQSFHRYAPEQPGWDRPGFLAESTEKRFTLESFFPVPLGFSSDAALARGIPAGAFATIGDPLDHLDTPNDTLASLDFRNLQLQLASLTNVLIGAPGTNSGVLTDPFFYIRNELNRVTADQTVTLFERGSSESTPRLTAADCLLGAQTAYTSMPPIPLAGTRREDWQLTHADGTAQFTSVYRFAPARLSALDFDGNGMVTRALAGNQADVRGMAADFFPDPDRAVRCLLFDARRLDCYGLFDPRFLDTLDKIDVLDARRADRAQYCNIFAQNGCAAVFIPPDIHWQLLLARGALANRMLLINADASHPDGQGFDTTDLAKLGPLPWRSVQDFAALNGKRQHDLEKFGISSEVVNELQTAAKKQIAAAAAARETRDYPAFFAATDAAWSLETQVYHTLIDTSNGIIKGVIFLLLGIIPFSYFLERLLIGATTIYRQIAGFAVIFALMTAALWFHPAFRISSAPLMILLAFLILILSSAVVYILWGKFEDEIARLRGSGVRGAAHSTSLRRGAVLGAAIRLGLSNMRRRGTRTALTLLTLILLTFTLLCFTSVTESVQVTPRVVSMPAGIPTPPPGILLRQRGWTRLPAQSLQWAAGLALPGPAHIAERWWYSSEQSEESWLVPVQGNKTFFAAGLVGLDAAEADFQPAPINQILPGFSNLKSRDDLCWLPEEAQRSDNFQIGQTVEILGQQLTIAGFFDDAGFRQLRQLTGDPFSPVDPGGSMNRPAAPAGDLQLASAPEAASRFLNGGSIAIIPAGIAQRIGARLTSIMIRPNIDRSRIFPEAAALARRSAFNIYASDGRQIRSINASMGSEPRDFGAVLVPMIIAAVIVLNTMLGAVSERTREIHVYTSIGLAPSHVGMLFLAEAAALGTIGVVAGYIFGQGLATVLSYTHWLPGVDLNYSSLSAIVTMGLVLGLVMVSALWPARAASRVAAPSLDRRWKLPKPIGDAMYVELPFTVNETASKGVIAFLEEFLVTTTQTGGRFTADAVKPFHRLQTTDHASVRGLAARIWLAPYDLGVIQTIRLEILPTEQPNIFDVHLELTREAGNPATWRRLNHPFLVEIRKQFLLWRSLAPEQMAQYAARSETFFNQP